MTKAATVNPFRYGALALAEAFTDREDELAELVTDARNGQDVVVFAPRRFGKTSLVWRARRSGLPQGVLVAHVNLMTTPTKEKLAEKLAKTIHDDIASVVHRARERPARLPRASAHAEDDGQPARRVALLRLRRRPAPRGRRCDARAPARASGRARRRPEPPRRRRLRRVPGGGRPRPQPPEAHALGLPGAARGRPRLPREQAPHDGADLQRRARAVLAKRKAARARSHRARSLPPFHRRAVRGRARTIDERALDRILEPRRGIRTRPRSSATSPGARRRRGRGRTWRRSRRASRACCGRSTRTSRSSGRARRRAARRPRGARRRAGRPYSEDYRRRHNLRSATNVQKALGALGKRELVARRPDGRFAITEPFFAEWIERDLDERP